MATVYQLLEPESAQFLATHLAQYTKENGTNFPVAGLAFDPADNPGEAVFWKVDTSLYGSGNLTLDLYWYASNATSGDVKWDATIGAITADADSQDVTTKSLATATTVTDTQLGTTSKRIMKCTITISNLDSLAAGDVCFLRVRRLGNDAADTMANDAVLTQAVLSYSDT